MSNRIYMYRITEWPRHIDMNEWRNHARELWGNPDKEFFLPDERKVYRSRSAAQAKVNIVRYWGGDAEVLEAEPEWTEVSEAARRRKRERNRARANKLRDRANQLDPYEIPF